MDDCASFFAADTFANDIGIRLITVSTGRSTMELTITDKHRNPHGTVHGGVIYSLADAAFAVASNSHGIPSVGINTSITFMKAATSGILYAEAEEFSKNPKLGTYIVEVYDQEREKIAVFQGLAYRRTPRITEKK
ncbi:MAG: PaaI family thioesterase [Methanobacteriota archaeon]